MHHLAPYQSIPHLPLMRVSITAGGVRMVGNLDAHIRYHINGSPLRVYMLRRFNSKYFISISRASVRVNLVHNTTSTFYIYAPNVICGPFASSFARVSGFVKSSLERAHPRGHNFAWTYAQYVQIGFYRQFG